MADAPKSREARRMARVDGRRRHVVAIPQELLDTVSRGAIATYLALGSFARPIVVDHTLGDNTPYEKAVGEVHQLQRERAQRFAGATGVWFCWPSFSLLAEDIPQASPGAKRGPGNVKAVRTWVTELEAAGWVLRFNRVDESKAGVPHLKSNLFLLAKLEPFAPPERTARAAPGRGETAPTGGVVSAPEKSDNPEVRTTIPTESAQSEELDTFGDSLLGATSTLGASTPLPPDREEVEF